MFRSSLNRVLDWAESALAPSDEEWAGDGGLAVASEQEQPPVGAEVELAAAEVEPAAAAEELAAAAAPPHPHRRELRWERERRPGSVPSRPAHCISPVVRAPAGARTRDSSAQ